MSDLKVTATDLTNLASSQRNVAANIEAAERATDGATMTVGRTHGLVCSLSIAALGEAQMSRTAATKAMNSVSNELAGKLDTAAADYSRTDQQEQGKLTGQMPPR
ncbi:ESX-1 secretion-associated protein [Mycobacterium sp. 21AC1]|uniref:type VII secretion target n=1 Tax=[Mycobacterium] appelbergii TaxID=2939269 RepID=UPI002938F625|nr:type VII secretion target [Mycobacterium sp. 21AC1]MDV3125660.1 ESX-1 secretion-associated protein [Mycobacterium sp. 21AC1]